MLETIAAVLVLLAVVGGLICAFWIEASYGVHGLTEDIPAAPVDDLRPRLPVTPRPATLR
ncbi:hypothetical protein CK222_31375 [Mesorhizobium sp. WSM3866]|nr:hypothetical protein CK222_31375 [Mesorhizobium sp. WSM3866]